MRKGMTRRELEVTDQSEIRSILEKCKYLHLGLVDGDEPYVVAMNFGYELQENDHSNPSSIEINQPMLTLYLHAATAGYKLDLIQKNPKVFFEMECDVIPFEGSVACKYGTSYSSIMGRGTAQILENVEEKKKAMSILMKTQTGQEFEFNDKLVSVISVIKICVSEYTAKQRPLP